MIFAFSLCIIFLSKRDLRNSLRMECAQCSAEHSQGGGPGEAGTTTTHSSAPQGSMDLHCRGPGSFPCSCQQDKARWLSTGDGALLSFNLLNKVPGWTVSDGTAAITLSSFSFVAWGQLLVAGQVYCHALLSSLIISGNENYRQGLGKPAGGTRRRSLYRKGKRKVGGLLQTGRKFSHSFLIFLALDLCPKLPFSFPACHS